MSRRKGGQLPGSSTTSMTTNKNEPQKTKIQEPKIPEDYSFIDSILSPEVVVQSFILGVTIHFAYYKLGGFHGVYSSHFQNCLVVTFAIIVGVYAKYKSSKFRRESLPNFQISYAVYLPFMLSLLFNADKTLINCALILNCIEIPIPFRIPMQWMFVQLQSTDYSNEGNFFGLFIILVNYFLSIILSKISDLKSLDSVDCNLFSVLLTNVFFLIQSYSIHFQVLKYTLMAFLMMVSFNFVLSFPLSYLPSCYLRSFILFSSFITGTPLLIKKLLRVENEDPMIWLVEYILNSDTRKRIMIIWLTSLLILIPNVLIFKSNFSLNTSRKVWHFLILLLISQPFVVDPQFVKIALAGTIILFLSVEYLRYLKLQPFGDYLDSKLRLFSDFRDDKGPIIISYIYLIIGISAPLLIADSPVGLISLGVGDSLASIIGGKWGKHRWPGTNKTIEGTIAFVLSTSISMYLFKHNFGYFQDITQESLFIVSLLSGLLEGNSTLNDNILIPAFMLIVEKLFST